MNPVVGLDVPVRVQSFTMYWIVKHLNFFHKEFFKKEK